MLAYRLLKEQTQPEFQEVPEPHAGPGQVVIKVAGSGLCHTDFDSSEPRLKLAREYGADDVVTSGPNAAEQIRQLTGGIGVAFVLDCVGINETLATGVAVLSWRGRLALVGAGGGSIPFDFFKETPGAQLVTSLNGGGVGLKEVVDMAALGRIKNLLDRYPLSAVQKAYDDFKQGHLVGRAVLIPEASAARAA